jgi:Alr-MurF fusion protein
MYTLQQIASITGSELKGDGDSEAESFFYDSRAHLVGAGAVFVAMQSKRNDGHRFIPGLIEKGVKAFMVRKGVLNYKEFQDAPVSFIISKDPLAALQALAIHHRQKFNIAVIGITGSNGKTIVKEWLYQLLKPEYVICRSPKSYNSQVGVPLSVLQLRSHHTLAIFEAGISKAGEMSKLEEMIRPTIGIFTSLGTAHDEGFRSGLEKFREKLLLFKRSGNVILNGVGNDEAKKIPFDHFTRISPEKGSLTLVREKNTAVLRTVSGDIPLSVPFSDDASLNNAATCAALLSSLNYSAETISERLRELHPVALRLELKKAIGGSYVINDFYNSDLDSLRIALNYLQHQGRRGKRIVIVSDIEQSGIKPDTLYRTLAQLFSDQDLHLLIGIGTEISSHREYFNGETMFFTDTADFTSQFKALAPKLANSTILLKGARSFGFERISSLLQLKSHDTVFEVNLNRLTENINYYRALTGPGVKIMCMVKATGYGSGSAEIARTLEHIGVNYLAVAYADEGVDLRESGIGLPIMVMSPEEGALEDIINNELEPEIYSFGVLAALVRKLDQLGIVTPYPVHIKIDTGMNRLGFVMDDIDELVKMLRENPQIQVVSVFSHLAGADSPALDNFTKEQLHNFESACAALYNGLGTGFMKHICNSAGISRFPGAHYDMVRLGIGMYGIGTSAHEQKQLHNVGSLRSRVSQVKNVSASQTVGYNRSGKIQRDTRIAIVPIGYADGFSRLLGNGRHGVFIHDIFCPTLGNICMDMCMVDVTGVTCAEGDEVVIFENTEQIFMLSKAMNTIPYEVLTSVSARVKRVYLHE